jgi:predicted GNAT superfamily acetyltransferase
MDDEKLNPSIRECLTIEEFDACVRLQREAFGLPDLEISPRRHLIVAKNAGGWVLGAFLAGELVGFVLHQVAVRKHAGEDEIIGYSHMMAVSSKYQNLGIGARLKWAQRERALREGRRFIKWTWDPMQARNAHFNINRLGVTVRQYAPNFYGTDYNTLPDAAGNFQGIDSDRLFAAWELDSVRVEAISQGREDTTFGTPVAEIVIPPNWSALIRENPRHARREQLRVREEFQNAFARRLVCAGFARDEQRPRYLLYE